VAENPDKRQKSDAKPKWHWSYLVCLAVQMAVVASAYYALAVRSFLVPAVFYWLVAILGILTIVLMIVGMVKQSISYVWWEALLLIFAFCGIWILCLAVLPLWLAVTVAGLVTLLPYLWPLTLWHDLAFLLGTAGIGLFAAMIFPSNVLLICAMGVVIYEAIRVRQAQIATLYAGAFDAGLPPGMLLPAEWNGWFKPIERTWQAGQGMVAGLLPFIVIAAMALRLARLGWAWFSFLGLLMGAVSVFWGKDRHGALRSWIFPAIAVVFYALAGIFIL